MVTGVNQPPTYAFTHAQWDVYATEALTYTASGTTDPDGDGMAVTITVDGLALPQPWLTFDGT